MTFIEYINKYKYVILISLVLFILPFFWLKPGEMDLGGDESRLFFYDPKNYIKSLSFFGLPETSTMGRGVIIASYYNIPYVYFIALLKFFMSSSTLVIDTINGIKLSGAFIAIYLLVFSFLQETYLKINKKLVYCSAILTGIFYVSSLGSVNLVYDWETAMNAQNGVFLYPFMAFLFFKFLTKQRYVYLYIALLISFIFSPNFSWITAPQFFAFYPIVFIFLLIYVGLFLKKSILWKGLFLGLLLFLCIQSFQLLGQIVNLFSSGNVIHERVSNKALIFQQGVGYFNSVAPHGKAILNLFLPSGNIFLGWLSIITPCILLFGFILNKKKEFYLISIFFLVTFFLVTANITHIGFEFYKSLFYIPSFSIFRVFYIKWMIVFLFFYALLFGFSVYSISIKLKSFYAKWFFMIAFIIFIIIGLPLLIGLPTKNSIIRGSKNIKTAFVMDPAYEKTLNFIRGLPSDGKILMLPLTDFYNQVILGVNGGAYQGPTTISQLTSKYSFSGDQDFGFNTYDPAPYSELMKKYAREKNYDRLLSIFSTLNIRFIFHNSDPRIYEEGFPSGGPYFYIRQSLPKTQKEYTDFIHQFPVHQIYKNGFYIIYELDKAFYNPTIFIPSMIYQSDTLSFDKDKIHAAFIGSAICKKKELKSLCNGEYKISRIVTNFTMLSPTSYSVKINQSEPVGTMLLVMQHMYDAGWKLSINGKEIAEDRHIVVNKYANGWVLFGKDLPKRKEYTVFIQHDQQKYFWYGWLITFVALIVIFCLLIIRI